MNYSGKFRLYRSDDWAKLPAMRWQIKDLVPLHGVTLLFGQPKIGKKSFIGVSQACAVAAGKDWCGHETLQGNVLYVVGEGFYGILRRQAAWEKAHGCSVNGSLRYLRAPVNFSNADDVGAALKALKAKASIPSSSSSIPSPAQCPGRRRTPPRTCPGCSNSWKPSAVD
jgi:hypothetical protein